MGLFDYHQNCNRQNECKCEYYYEIDSGFHVCESSIKGVLFNLAIELYIIYFSYLYVILECLIYGAILYRKFELAARFISL